MSKPRIEIRGSDLEGYTVKWLPEGDEYQQGYIRGPKYYRSLKRARKVARQMLDWEAASEQRRRELSEARTVEIVE